MSPATLERTTTTTTCPSPVARKLLPALQAIRALARKESDQYNEWQDGDEAAYPPPPAYLNALADLLNGFDSKVMSGADAAMLRLHDEYNRHRAENPSGKPRAEFWLAREEALLECLKEREAIPAIKSVAELQAEKVPHYTIARMWCLFLEGAPAGQQVPDIQAVAAELANPGSVLTPEAVDRAYDQLAYNQGIGVDPRVAALKALERDEQQEQPAEEEEQQASLEKMIRSGANFAQITRAKATRYPGTSPDAWYTAAKAVAAAMGVTLPESGQQVANEGGNRIVEAALGREVLPQDIHVQHREAPSHTPDPGTVETVEVTVEEIDAAELGDQSFEGQVATLFAQGHDANAIARALNTSPKRVRAAIAK